METKKDSDSKTQETKITISVEVEELEERIAPRRALNHNETMLQDLA